MVAPDFALNEGQHLAPAETITPPFPFPSTLRDWANCGMGVAIIETIESFDQGAFSSPKPFIAGGLGEFGSNGVIVH